MLIMSIPSQKHFFSTHFRLIEEHIFSISLYQMEHNIGSQCSLHPNLCKRLYKNGLRRGIHYGLNWGLNKKVPPTFASKKGLETSKISSNLSLVLKDHLDECLEKIESQPYQAAHEFSFPELEDKTDKERDNLCLGFKHGMESVSVILPKFFSAAQNFSLQKSQRILRQIMSQKTFGSQT
jgi:hypothetical protein